MVKILSLILVVFLYSLLFVNSTLATCHGGPGPIPGTGCQPAGLNQIEALVSRVISLAVPLAFVALVIVLVISGIKFLTSGGEAKALQAAGLTLTWAILGILFLAIAWLILQLIENFTGVRVTIFDIKVLCVPGIRGC